MSEHEHETSGHGRTDRSREERIAKVIALAGVCIAIQFVTEYYLSVTGGSEYRVSLTFLMRDITGYVIGWIGGPVAAIADILGGYIFYGGGMIPALTAIRFAQGLVSGLILYRKINFPRILCVAFVSTLGLNICSMYVRFGYEGLPFVWETVCIPLSVYAISCIVEILVLMAFRAKLLPTLNRMMYNRNVWKMKETRQQK